MINNPRRFWAVGACLEAIYAHMARFRERPTILEMDWETYRTAERELIWWSDRIPRFPLQIDGAELRPVGL